MKTVQCHYHPSLLGPVYHTTHIHMIRYDSNGRTHDDRPTAKLFALHFRQQQSEWEKNKSRCAKFLSIALLAAECRCQENETQKKAISAPHTGTLLNDHYSHVHKHEMIFWLLLVYSDGFLLIAFTVLINRKMIYILWDEKKFSVNTRLCVKFSSKEMSNEQRLPAVQIAKFTNEKQLRAWEALTASTD